VGGGGPKEATQAVGTGTVGGDPEGHGEGGGLRTAAIEWRVKVNVVGVGVRAPKG